MTNDELRVLVQQCWDTHNCNDRPFDIVKIFVEHDLKHLGVYGVEYQAAMYLINQMAEVKDGVTRG